MAKTRGFTYSELSAVVLLLVIVSSAVLPNIVNKRRGEQWRAFKSRLKTVGPLARGEAIARNATVDVTFDATNGISVKTEGKDGSTGTSLLTVPLVETISAKDFRAGDQSKSSADWILKFYPDGSSDQGGISFTEGQDATALSVNKKGIGVLMDALPDAGSSEWDAGTYESR